MAPAVGRKVNFGWNVIAQLKVEVRSCGVTVNVETLVAMGVIVSFIVLPVAS